MKDAVVTDKERKAEEKAAKESKKTDTGKKDGETQAEIIERLFGADGVLGKGLGELGKSLPKTASTNTSGKKVEEGQQKKTESKADKLKSLTTQRDAAMQPVITNQEEAPIMGGESNEIIVPGKDKNDADDFLMPKFGVLTEFNTTLSNLM